MMVSPAKQQNLIQNTIKALKMPDLQKRVKFLLFAFAVYAIGSHIPNPGIDAARIESFFEQAGRLTGGAFFGLINMFTGGALKKFSIFALGVIPYINGSIIVQLLTAAFPQLEQLRKEGEWGRKKLAQYTRIATLLSAVLQGWGFIHIFIYQGALPADLSFLAKLRVLVSLTAGTAFLMWLGEMITERGIGNGVSLIIFGGIVMRLPGELASLFYSGTPLGSLILLLTLFLLTLVFIVYVQQSQRRIPVTYTRRMVGNRLGNVSSYLPIPVNIGGVIPIIFGLAVIYFPVTVSQFIPPNTKLPFLGWQMLDIQALVERIFNPAISWFALFIYAICVFAFTYFYAAIIYRPDEIAENIRKYGGVVPGIRPGHQTIEYIDRVATRITFSGAVFLAIVAMLEYFVPKVTGIPESQFGLIGGTSILIAVSVAMETMKQLEAQLLLRQYETFIR